MSQRSEDHLAAFIAALQDEMARQKKTERALSEELGKNKNFINDLVHRQHVLKFVEFIEISDKLGVSPYEFLARVLRP